MIDFDQDGFAFVAPDDPDYDAYVMKCEKGGVAPARYRTWLKVFKRQPSDEYLAAAKASRTDRVLQRFDEAIDS